ncbi:MAG: hypothetical protein H7A48_14100 [Akkermansiaceae bacterium]|nr:hypothetical protein [Akkermansiaceae bacterium]MCP5547858.1 hypothetical protein [Akkermansiaceae bacterium]
MHLCFFRTLAILVLASKVHAGPNLVPARPSTEPNYWCTWYSQNYWIGRGSDLPNLGGVTNAAAREQVNERTVFDEADGWARKYLPRGREDFIFLIDHGWQTKDPAERVAGGPEFFSMVTDGKDFPRYAGLAPDEALRRFNADIRKLGWRSLGLWFRGNVTAEQARTFAKWSKHADIRYWKIDGGDTREFHCFKAKQEIFPELVLEYVTGAGGNINPKWDRELAAYPSVYDFGGSLREPMLACLKHSDVFRTYDASPLLMTSTTLRRVHDILRQTQQQPEYRALLNVQDDCNLAVGLGVLVASKRHPETNQRTYKGRDLHHQLSGPRHMQGRIDEAQRFGRWSRIAPAFPAGQGTYLSSELELVDRCRFTEWDTWARNTYGKMVSQSAPAIMARNMPLPVVEADGPPPFVCASTYPNGATGIATEGRVRPDERWSEPRAKVRVRIQDASKPIGVVGRYESLALGFAGPLGGLEHVWAQDLLATESEDILPHLSVEGDTLVLSGDLIDRIGSAAATPGDRSAPGLVLRLEGERLPRAGDEFTPVVRAATGGKTTGRPDPGAAKQADGFAGTAGLEKDGGGYNVRAEASTGYVLKRLPQTVTSGTYSVTWTMKPLADPRSRNGFVILASDDAARSAVVAGSWIGSKKMTVFENRDDWTSAPTRRCAAGEEVTCRLTVDLDARTAVLTIAGRSMETTFSESFTSISHIGFGVHQAATRFDGL